MARRSYYRRVKSGKRVLVRASGATGSLGGLKHTVTPYSRRRPPRHYNHPMPGSLAYANIVKTQVTDPTVPRDYNEPTRKYSKPKVPGVNT